MDSFVLLFSVTIENNKKFQALLVLGLEVRGSVLENWDPKGPAKIYTNNNVLTKQKNLEQSNLLENHEN